MDIERRGPVPIDITAGPPRRAGLLALAGPQRHME